MPKQWVKERKRDFYYKKAKEEKYRSRAAYKLFQSVEKHHFIKEGNVVVDLGAAPGGWTQAARKIVGNKGFVLAVDIKPIKPFLEKNVCAIVSDMKETKTLQKILEIIPRKADAVISDASPNISGIWEFDHACQIDLAEYALQIALNVLCPSGKIFFKVFQGDLLNVFLKKLGKNFKFVKIVKPKASKAKSAELFVLAM